MSIKLNVSFFVDETNFKQARAYNRIITAMHSSRGIKLSAEEVVLVEMGRTPLCNEMDEIINFATPADFKKIENDFDDNGYPIVK